jgi:hypothetical protein
MCFVPGPGLPVKVPVYKGFSQFEVTTTNLHVFDIILQWNHADKASWGDCSLFLKDRSFCGINPSKF